MTPISVCSTSSPSSGALTRSPAQHGFTLLEILLVLAIVAMASIFVVPNLGGFETRTFNTQVRQAHSLLNYARRTAVVSGQASTVSFNVLSEEERDRQQRDDEYSSSSNIVAQWNGPGIELRFRDSTDREIEIDSSTEVTFYPEGGSTGGILLFAQAEQLGIIDVDPFTGKITTRDPDREL